MTETAPDRCRRYRRRILEISRQVPAAHVSPAFSCVEIVDALYSEVMRPQDVFIMSKGHGWLAQLVVLEDRGAIPREEVDLYCRPGGRLGSHPDRMPDLGVHASTGSLGHGLGIAAGMAYAERMRGSDVRVYVLLSDGECQEGSTWEAAAVAANLGLANLTILVDANDWGGMDRMSDAHPHASVFSLSKKFSAFGWVGNAIDGHDPALIARTLVNWNVDYQLSAIVCRTVKGMGVSFMESGQPLWHYRSPTAEEYAQALEELSR